MTDANEGALDQRARRAAKRAGLMAVRSRWRRDSVDNRGGFQILDPYRNSILVGRRFDVSAEEVIAFCAKQTADAKVENAMEALSEADAT